METEKNPEFWEWLKEKARSENAKKPFEPIPLHISVDLPTKYDDEANEDTLINYEIDFEVDNVVFEL